MANGYCPVVGRGRHRIRIDEARRFRRGRWRSRWWVTPVILPLILAILVSAAPANSGIVRYELKGRVVAVNRARQQVTVRHEKVGDYMEAMTMPFFVRDPRELERLRVGDGIRATLVVTADGGQWLEGIVVLTAAGSGTSGGDR